MKCITVKDGKRSIATKFSENLHVTKICRDDDQSMFCGSLIMDPLSFFLVYS